MKVSLMRRNIMRRVYGCFLFLFLVNCERRHREEPSGEKCSKYYKMQNLNGDYILGGFVPAHTGTGYKLNYRSIAWASAMLYAIEEINKDNNLLPGIHLGYDIRDSCHQKPLATRYTLDYLLDSSFLKPALDTNKYINSPCIDRGNSHNIIFGVVGAHFSTISTVINNLLGVDYIPQVSYGSTSAALSEHFHRSFLRTVPSDIHQANAIVDLLTYFDWSYVSAFVADDEYGRIGLDETRKNIKKKKLCLAGEIIFSEKITGRDLERIISHLRKLGGKSHVVIIWSSVTNAKKIMIESQRRNIAGITWIGTEAWGTHPDLKSAKISLKENIIGLEIQEQATPGFEKAFTNSVSLHCGNPWFKEFLYKNQKMFPFCDLRCSQNVSMCQKLFIPILASTLQRKKIGQVLAAVYALAQGLHKTLNCTKGACVHTNQAIDYRSVYNNILKSDFVVPDSNYKVQFDKNGEVVNTSYIFKFYNPRIKRRDFKIFGRWSSVGTLSVNASRIKWGKQQKPVAHCSNDCAEGYFRINGSSSCCWSCAACFRDTITNGINRYQCVNCSQIQISNTNHTKCVMLQNIRMKLFDQTSIIHFSLALFGILCTLFVIGVFIKYWETPVVKSTSREMSCIQLVSIMLLFAFAGLSFIPSSPKQCMIQVLVFAFLQCTILSLILVKTYRLLLVFRERFTAVSRFLHNKYQIAFSYIFVLVIVIAISLWFVYFPTELKIITNRAKMTYHIRCSNDAIWFVVLFYLLLLELVITIMAFRARKLPENFNEVQFIVFTMFTDIIVWMLVFLALYVSLNRLLLSDAFLHVNFTSNFCRLFILYGYRVRIILLYPELNSPEHFRKTAAGSTITNFVKDVMRGDGTSKRSIKSVVIFDSESVSLHGKLTHQPVSMSYSYTSLKQSLLYEPSPDTTAILPANLNEAYNISNLNTASNQNSIDASQVACDLAEPESSLSTSDKGSTTSLQSLTPDVLKSPLHDTKKWVSTQLLPTKDPCSDDECNASINLIPRASSLDCMHRLFPDRVDKNELKALLTMDETSM